MFDVAVEKIQLAAEGQWIMDGGTPGVHVVQQPISQVFGDEDCEGYVMMALDPGIKLCLTSDNVPWIVDEPTRDCNEKQKAACVKGEELVREKCRRAAAPKAMFRDKNGNRKI